MPGEKSIRVSQQDAGFYMKDALGPDGRLKGTLHPETSRRNDTLGPTATPREDGLKLAPGLASEPETRGRMILLLCDVLGQSGPEDVSAAGEDEAQSLGEVGRVLKELVPRMSHMDFSAAVSRAVKPRIEAAADDRARRSLNIAANWLRAKSKDAGMR